MNTEESPVKVPETEPLEGLDPPPNTVNQQADLSAIMHFNADKRFSITE